MRELDERHKRSLRSPVPEHHAVRRRGSGKYSRRCSQHRAQPWAERHCFGRARAPHGTLQPKLASANDFTLGVTYTVGSTPASVAVDGSGNIWVANNASSSVSKLTHAGTPTATYTTGGLNLPTSIAIDSGGNAWVSNTNNSLTQISTAGTGAYYTGGGLNAPTAIAINGLGMIWVANGGSTTLSPFSNTGSALSGSPFSAAPVNGTGELAVGINPR